MFVISSSSSPRPSRVKVNDQRRSDWPRVTPDRRTDGFALSEEGGGRDRWKRVNTEILQNCVFMVNGRQVSCILYFPDRCNWINTHVVSIYDTRTVYVLGLGDCTNILAISGWPSPSLVVLLGDDFFGQFLSFCFANLI